MRLFRALRLIALAYVVFMLGVAFTVWQYPKLKSVTEGIGVLWGMRHLVGTGDWAPAGNRGSGVLRHDKARVAPGYTLYNVTALLTTELVDMDGKVVWRWRLAPEELFEPDPGTFFGLIKPHIDASILYPNGDLLVIYAQRRQGTYGGSLVRLDKDSKILWRADVNAHHAMKPVGDKIYTLTHQIAFDPIPGVPYVGRAPYIDDMVSVLDDRGSLISSHSLLRMMAKTKGLDLVSAIPFDERGDFLHPNDVEVLDEKSAGHFPGARPGNVLVSLRHASLLVVFDLDKEQAVWAMRGGWQRQHDPDLLPNGRMLLFDNEGGLKAGSRSRVIELDVASGGVVWSYDGSSAEPFYTDSRGGQHRLANGNTLIAHAAAGRIIEVTPAGDIVWEYVLSHRATENGQTLIPYVGLTTERYDPAFPAFLKEAPR